MKMETFMKCSGRVTILYFVLVSQSWATISQTNDTNAARWITDGAVGFAINGDVVTYVHNGKGDYCYNAMWQDGDGVSSGKHYWKIHFPTLNGGTVGFTSTDYFSPGYGKGIHYLGNLSNGHSRLVGSFGPNPKQGDTIGILAVFEDDRLRVYIDVNGTSLGLAFDVPDSTFKSIYPVVSFRNSGSATCTKQTDIPNITIRTPKIFTGIEGDWQLNHLTDNNVEQCLIRTSTAKITKKKTNEYWLNLEVVNFMWTELLKVNGTWKTSRCCDSTYVNGDRQSLNLEYAVERLFKQVKMVEVVDNGKLHVKSGAMASVWTRYDATPGPFVGDPFFKNGGHRIGNWDFSFLIAEVKCFIQDVFNKLIVHK